MAQFIKVWTPLEPDFVKYFNEHYQSRAGMYVLYTYLHDSENCSKTHNVAICTYMYVYIHTRYVYAIVFSVCSL